MLDLFMPNRHNVNTLGKSTIFFSGSLGDYVATCSSEVLSDYLNMIMHAILPHRTQLYSF